MFSIKAEELINCYKFYSLIIVTSKFINRYEYLFFRFRVFRDYFLNCMILDVRKDN